MIDLSFLTEEEQEAIMKVLQRDAVLKRAEEERVRHLPEKIKDDQQLKNMSGQWFYEAKAKRHRDKVHGADIIRASMRKKKPQVAAEQSKDRTNGAKESWVNNVNKDALLSPELAGVVEEPGEDAAPTSPSSNVLNPASTVIGMCQENTRQSPVSQAKQRKNPFNSYKLPEDHLSLQTKNEQSKTGRTGLFQSSKEGKLSESKEKSSIQDISSQNLEKPKQTFPDPVNESQIKPPIPKARKMIYKSTDLKQNDNQSFPRQWTDSLNTRGAPRGILKRNSSSSSTDSEITRFNQNFESKSKIVSPSLIIHENISEKEHSLGDDSSPNSLEPFKHVRFSAMKDELPQSPGLIQCREVGEFSVLESDRLKNGTEDAEDINEFQNDPVSSQYRKPLPFLHQSSSSPSASKNETHQPAISGSFPINGSHSHSEVSTRRPRSFENSPTINEHKAKSSELSRLESELSSSPADKPSQISDDNSRDHQQGKPPLLMALKAESSSRSGPHATEIMKTTDDSISKVLDWFNRSSASDDKSSLKHLQRTESKEKSDLKSQMVIAMVTDHTSLKENGSKALSAPQVELKPVTSDSTHHVEGDLLPSRNDQDDVSIKSKSVNLSQQSTQNEDPGLLRPFESYSPSQGNKSMDYSLGSKSIVRGNGVSSPTSDYFYSVLKGSGTEYQVPRNIKDVGSLGKEGPKFHIHGKSGGNSEMNFDSSTMVEEQSLKNNMKAERKSKGGDNYVLKTSLESENIELPPETANCGYPWKKPEVQLQQEASELPKNQMQREKYKRVSDRISFWEGEKAAAKLTRKDPTSSCSQGQTSAKAYQLVNSQSEYNQVTAKQGVLDEDVQTSPASSFYSSNKPKETRPQISVPSKGCPSADKSGEVSLFQYKINEPKKILPVADSLHSGRDITLPVRKHTSDGSNEVHYPGRKSTPLEKDHAQISEPNPNFKVLSLKERMSETSTEQFYNHSQFENLRKFWDLEANSNGKANVEKNAVIPSHKNSVPLDSQKHKEFSDVKSSEKSTHEEEVLLSQKEVLEIQEMGKLNSKCVPQVPSDETTFSWRPPREIIPQLPGNESFKKNMENNKEWFIAPEFKEENDYLDQDIQESMVKTSVLSKDYKDTCNDSLQKQLSVTSPSAIQPSGEKGHVKQVLQAGVSENRAWPQKTGFTDAEEEAERLKEIISEHINKTVAPPNMEYNTLTASLDKLLKEATGASPSPLQTKLEPVSTRPNSEPEESRVFEKGMEQSHGTSAHEREIKALFPEGEETLGNTAVLQKVQSGECQLNTKNLLQMAAEASHPLNQPPHLHKKGSFGDEANSPQDLPSSWDSQRETSQKEISETVEKVILPPKATLNDVNTALQKLLREAWLSYSAEGEVDPGEVRVEFPQEIQAADSLQNSLGVTVPWATMDTIVPDRKDFYSVSLVSDKTHEIRSYVTPEYRAAQMSPTEQTLSSFGSAVAQYGKELPEEVTEIVREMIIQPKSQVLKFSAGLEKILEETIKTIPSKYENEIGILSSSRLVSSPEEPRQAAPDFHPDEIKETVEKAEAPSITENAFDTGLEKLLKEIFKAPPYQLQVSVKEDIPDKESSQSEETRSLGTEPPFYWAALEASEMKVESNILKFQVNQCDKVLGGDKVVTDLSVDLCGSESRGEIPGTPQLYLDHEMGTIETIKTPEDRDNESEVVGGEWVFQKPCFREGPEAISVPRNSKSIPGLENKEKPTKTSKVELILLSPCKTQEKEEEKEGFSDSDFSDGNIGSNAESWKNSSSEHFGIFNPLVKESAL